MSKGNLLVTENMLNRYHTQAIGDLASTGIGGGGTVAEQLGELNKWINGVKVVSWAKGTDEDIAAMIKAADEGKIDLTKYWNVGDERVVHLSPMAATYVDESHVEQDVTMVLAAADTGEENKNNPCWNYQYVTPTSGRKWPSFIVHQKTAFGYNNSNEFGYVVNNSYEGAMWADCVRRTWCNEVYKNAFPTNLIDIFKQVIVKTAGKSALETTNDYFFLPSIIETNNDSQYIGQSEADALCQWPYFETESNRLNRQRGTNASYNMWFTRTSHNGSAIYYRYVGRDGKASGVGGSEKLLIFPSGCI